MQALGELSTLYPSAGAFTELSGRFIDGSVAVALGYNYWYLWASNLAAEYNLIAIVLSYWTDKVPEYGWILIFWAFYQCIGMLGVIVSNSKAITPTRTNVIILKGVWRS